MDVRLTAFASEIVKLSEAKEKNKSYGQQVVSALPFAVATSAAEVPKGWVDKYVDQAVRGISKKERSSGFGRGVGRGIGRLAPSAVTAPIFMSGVQDIQSDDKSTQRRGVAKVLGSSLVYGAVKGGIETGIEDLSDGRKGGVSWSKLLQRVKGTAGARSLVAAGAGALTAAAVARGQKKSESESSQVFPLKAYAAPAAVGAAAGAAKGGFEEAWELGSKATRRGIAGRAAGRAAAGAMGALAISSAFKHFAPKKQEGPPKVKPGKVLRPSKKDPTVRRWQSLKTASVSPPPDTYDDVRSWARGRDTDDVYGLYKEIVADGQGERSPSRRAAHYALADEIESRGGKVPAPKMRDRVHNEISAPSSATTAAFALVAASPGLVLAATAGMKPDDRDRVLTDALDRQFILGKLQRVEIDPGDIYKADPIGKAVHIPKSDKALPGLVAHELGHMTAGPLRKSLLYPKVLADAHKAGAAASVILPLLAIEASNYRRFTTPEELESRANMIRNIGILAGAAQAPVLAEEVIANVKAVELLRKAGAGAGEAAQKVLTHAGPGFATYAMPAVLPFLVASHLRRKAARGRRDEK